MNSKQKRFCHEYIVDQNGKQSAIRAGYSPHSAESQASRLLRKAKVAKYLKKLQRQIEKRNKITIDECVSLLAKIARVDIADLYDADGNMRPVHEIPRDTRTAIAELTSFEEYVGKGNDRELVGHTRKAKLLDRRAAIVELMKHLGGYRADNEQKTPDLNIPIERWLDQNRLDDVDGDST